jgi:folylpolyglutamate synthase/dihydropteroate synthase
LKAALLSLGIKSTAMFSEPEDAVQWIESDVSKATTVLCIGSLYLQGNLLKILGADSDADLAVLMESTT